MKVDRQGCLGTCCEGILMIAEGVGQLTPLQLKAYGRLNDDSNLSVCGRMLEHHFTVPAYMSESGLETYLYRCRHFDSKEQLCTIYDKRPQMCRNYPGPGGCRREGCKFKHKKDKDGIRGRKRKQRRNRK